MPNGRRSSETLAVADEHEGDGNFAAKGEYEKMRERAELLHYVLTAGGFAARRIAPDSICRRPRAMSRVVVFSAFGLVARRQMRVGRGLCEMQHNDANRDRFQNVAEQLRR